MAGKRDDAGTTVHTLIVATFVALLLWPPSAAAQIPEPWRGRLSDIERARRDGRYETVMAAAGALAEDMAQRLPAGEAGRRALALTLTYHAIGAVMMKRPDDALWSWQIAQNLNPALRTAPIPKSYGDAGAWLAARRLRQPGVFDGAVDAPSQAAVPSVAPSTALSEGGEREGLEDALEIEAVIDREGRVQAPVVVGGGESPGQVYSALSNLREWRFEPAREAGEPVPMLYRIDSATAGRLTPAAVDSPPR